MCFLSRYGFCDIDRAYAVCFFSGRRRHTRCALVTGVQTCALPILPQVDVGTRAWAILAVGSPRALDGMGAGRIGTFANDDDSADQLRSKLMLAGLAGLGRLEIGRAHV